MLENGIVPIVNENDAIATAKLKFGDNDRLSALVAQMTQADLLVILSDIEGLYTADPNLNKDAEFISVVEEIDEEIEALAGGATSSVGTGGMSTKVQAATIASESGCETVITSGKDQHAIRDLFMNNKRHTLFKAVDNPKTARQKWILNTLKTNGSVTIDEGAHNAILKGKSLLPVGITVVDGTFSRGDKISINNIKGEEIAIGITAYASTDLFRIIGKHTDEIESILGFSGREYAVYANDLVVLE